VPEILLACYAALLGLAVGSFLNVVVWRVPRGESVMRPPSACPRCGHRIRARDNVPVLGWLLLRGKCRDCGEPISPRYPLVEALCGLLFAVMAVKLGLDPVLPAYLYFVAVGLALALIDLDTRRLPDALTLPSYPVAAVLLTVGFLFGDHPGALLRAGVGAAAFGVVYFVIWYVKPGGMGYGDVKLAPVVGAYLGWVSYGALVVGFFLGFLYGSFIGVGLMLFGKAGRKSKVPYGPFMLAGALTAVLVGEELAQAYVDITLGG
jgi:leader peptidase (prepilin peptidase) / N-methyltransferase